MRLIKQTTRKGVTLEDVDIRNAGKNEVRAERHVVHVD